MERVNGKIPGHCYNLLAMVGGWQAASNLQYCVGTFIATRLYALGDYSFEEKEISCEYTHLYIEIIHRKEARVLLLYFYSSII